MRIPVLLLVIASELSETATITVKRAESVATSMAFYKAINAGTAELVDTLNDTITIPPMGQTIVTYTAKVLDQYGSEIGSATVDNGEITEAIVPNLPAMTYTGAGLEPTVTVTGLTLDTDYTVDYENNIDIDITAQSIPQVTITGIGNYHGTVYKTFTINKATITSLATTEYHITGWDKTIDDLKAIDASIENQTVTLTPTFNAPVWATIMNTPTYIFTITNKFPVNVNITTAIDDVVYGATLATPVAEQTAIDNGTDTTATFSYLYEGVNGTTYNSETPPTDAGEYQVTASLVSDTHSGSATDNFTIAQKALADDMLAITGTYTYTGDAIAPTYTLVDGIDTIATSNYTATPTNNTNAGTATLEVVGANNYSGTISKTFEIGKKESQPIEDIDKDYLYSKANLNNVVDITGLPDDRGITTFTSVENDVNSIIENRTNTVFYNK